MHYAVLDTPRNPPRPMLTVDSPYTPLRAAQLLWLMLPAYVANMAPPFVKYWPWWNRPIDERRLGGHKTVVGFAFGVVAALLAAFVQSRIDWAWSLARDVPWPSLGIRLGIGAMAGDSVKSWFKRRVGIAPGHPWIPADQMDYLVGALLLVWPVVPLAWSDVLLLATVGFVGHFIITRIGFWLGVRDVRY